MGFFNTVTYSKSIQDNSWFSKAESLADACRAPAKWVAAEICGTEKTYNVSMIDNKAFITSCVALLNESLAGKVARIVGGLILAVPGYLLSIPLMGAAYLSEEIRLKHAFSEKKFTEEQKQRLSALIQERTSLAQEQQGHMDDPCACLCLWLLICIICAE